MSRKMVSIHEAAEFLGVSPQTLRRWEREGKLLPDERTAGGRRRYDLARLRPEQFRAGDAPRRTIAYARVSSHDQKDDLERQKQVLERYCARQGWTFEVIADLGSGMNYHKKGLKRLLDAIIEGQVGRLVITHKDRLLRFGAELVFAIVSTDGKCPQNTGLRCPPDKAGASLCCVKKQGKLHAQPRGLAHDTRNARKGVLSP